jgi:hypothetical protein
MKYLGVEVESEERSRSKKSKLKRKERDETPYTSARWVPYVKVSRERQSRSKSERILECDTFLLTSCAPFTGFDGGYCRVDPLAQGIPGSAVRHIGCCTRGTVI